MEITSSVLIPTYNRSTELLEAVQSVIAQDAQFEFEILILDNASDPTLRIDVGKISARSRMTIQYIPVPEIGLHNCRHAGAKVARGEILVFVDDDVIANKGWLQSMVDTFNDPAVHLVGGPILPRYESDPPDWLEEFWKTTAKGKRSCSYLSLLDFGREPCQIDPDYIWGANFAIRRETLNRVGGFHPDSLPWELRRFRGDGETAVTHKARSLKLKAFYQPVALVFHRVPQSRMTIEYFEKRAYLQGISNSFTRIRTNGGILPAKITPPFLDWKASLLGVKKVVRQLLKLETTFPPEPYHEIKARVKAAYQVGYKYHQYEIHNDPTLLEWVLRPDYWDGSIPQSSEHLIKKIEEES